MKVSIKKDKTSFYAVSNWISAFNYERQDKIYNILLKSPEQHKIKIRENPYKVENWNSPHNDFPMVLEFKDSFLAMKFLLQMSEYVERTL